MLPVPSYGWESLTKAQTQLLRGFRGWPITILSDETKQPTSTQKVDVNSKV
jgi:hypothetical protein